LVKIRRAAVDLDQCQIRITAGKDRFANVAASMWRIGWLFHREGEPHAR
jgi:hypothetical protein